MITSLRNRFSMSKQELNEVRGVALSTNLIRKLMEDDIVIHDRFKPANGQIVACGYRTDPP